MFKWFKKKDNYEKQKPIVMPTLKGIVRVSFTAGGIKNSGMMEVQEISRKGSYSECKVLSHTFHPVFDKDVENFAKLIPISSIEWYS